MLGTGDAGVDDRLNIREAAPVVDGDEREFLGVASCAHPPLHENGVGGFFGGEEILDE